MFEISHLLATWFTMSIAFRERYYHWNFDEELANNAMCRESTKEPSVYNESSSTLSDLHYSENDIAIDSELDNLSRRLEASETLSGPSHTSWHPSYNSPSLDFQRGPDFRQVNATFQPISRNDHFTPSYNSGWRDYPDLSWNHGHSYQAPPPHFQKPNSYPIPSQVLYSTPIQTTAHPPGFLESNKRPNLEKSLDALLKSTDNLAQTQTTFMQTMTSERHLLNSNVQTLSKLEFHLSQIATMCEREEPTTPNPPEVNPDFSLTHRPIVTFNAIIPPRSSSQVDTSFGDDSQEEESNSEQVLSLGQTKNPDDSEFVASPREISSSSSALSLSSSTSPSKPPPEKPKEFHAQPIGANLVKEVVSWSNLANNEIESSLKQDFKLHYETNLELQDSFQDLTSDEMLGELHDICSKWENQLTDRSCDPNSVGTTFFEEPPPPVSISSFSTRAPSFINTHDISSDLVHDQHIVVINLLKQQKEAFTWSMDEVMNMSFILVPNQIIRVVYATFVGEFLKYVGCITKIVFPRAGIG